MDTPSSFPERIVTFFEQNRWLNIMLVVLYIFFILHGHDFFVQLSVKVMNSFTLKVYNQIVMLCIVSVGIILVLYTLYSLTVIKQQWKVKLLFFLGCLFYLFVHVSTLFEMNIEIIHIVEYIVLSFLLFPFTRSIGATLIFALPVMIGDELNQYLVLYPGYNKYFEWSDILMDIVGSGMLLLLLNIAGLHVQKRVKAFLVRPELILLVFLYLCLFVGWFSGALVSTTAEMQSNTIFVFNQLKQPELFWQTHAFTGARYHVLWPMEGALLILLLFSYFIVYDQFVGE